MDPETLDALTKLMGPPQQITPSTVEHLIPRERRMIIESTEQMGYARQITMDRFGWTESDLLDRF